MRHWLAGVLLAGATMAAAQAAAPAQDDALEKLAFLEGTWAAQTTGGSAGAASQGAYTFQRELKGHVLARHTQAQANCSGPADYNCAHSDLLYIYEEGGAAALKAIFFDSEGHVIRYTIALPKPDVAVFVSEESAPGPQFRLTYQRQAGTLTGQFEIRMPGQTEWRTYLGWTGGRL